MYRESISTWSQEIEESGGKLLNWVEICETLGMERYKRYYFPRVNRERGERYRKDAEFVCVSLDSSLEPPFIIPVSVRLERSHKSRIYIYPCFAFRTLRIGFGKRTLSTTDLN